MDAFSNIPTNTCKFKHIKAKHVKLENVNRIAVPDNLTKNSLKDSIHMKQMVLQNPLQYLLLFSESKKKMLNRKSSSKFKNNDIIIGQ